MYAEYIYYRKVGDHGTNMPSSIYFGKNKNNRFSVSDNIKYKYDEMGNISEVRENGVLTVKYAYDKIGRLVREDNRKFGKSIFISYDNCGNILSKRETQFTLKPTDEIEVFTEVMLYAYDGDILLAYGGESIVYKDAQNNKYVNPLFYRGHELGWNYGKQLARFGENSFAYDGYGRRIRKNNTVYIYDANNKLVKQSDGNNTLEFVYDNNGLSGVTYNGTEYIYSKDIQGNIVGILDKSGKEVVQYSYDAWGNHKTTVLDGAHAAIAELNPFRYRSYFYDPESNLYYLNTRYYDPETGRFISQDDVSYLDPEHVNGLNLFAYCGNNPVMNVDPNGNSITALVVLIILGIVVGTVSSGVFSGLSEMASGGNFMDGFWGGLANGFISTVGLALGIAASIFFTPAAGIAIAGFFGAVGGLVGGMITEGIKNDWDVNRFDWGSIGISMATGAASNILSCALGGYLIKDAGIVFKSFLDAFVKNLAISSFTYVSWAMIGWPMFAISLIPLMLSKKKEEKQKQYATT